LAVEVTICRIRPKLRPGEAGGYVPQPGIIDYGFASAHIHIILFGEIPQVFSERKSK